MFLQSVLRYCLSHPLRAAYSIASDPLEILTAFQKRYVASRERRVSPELYQADDGWECRMHELLDVPQSCPAISEFWALWPEVMAELQAKGIRAGPESYKGWNDGDAAFVRAIWCLCRHLRPTKVVETGVAHGVSSRFILEALERNGGGHLWSVDYPPLERVWHEQIGAAVGGRYSAHWSYIRGSSERRLPGVFSQLGQIDLFVHDSLHSEQNVRFEMDRAWAILRPGGAIVVDDIDANWGFKSFVEAFSGHRPLICEAEPLRPDLRRFNKKGLFGIILKEPTALQRRSPFSWLGPYRTNPFSFSDASARDQSDSMNSIIRRR